VAPGTLPLLRVAVIADIHANLAALEACLDSVEEAGVDEVWCLGDVVGYGPDPDACTELVRERCALCLAGNHDLAVLGELEIEAFSESAAAAVTWTQGVVADETLEFLRSLEPAGRREGVDLCHASPRDPIWEYVLTREQADACLDAQSQRICLIGHSHVALFFTRLDGTRGKVRSAQAADGSLIDVSGGRWLINPGSVGQPRDSDPRAAWLALDTDAGTVLFQRVAYDIERTAEAIAAADLPQPLADRLFIGH
jgi:diadenosine tetraphosphatase ApaH/serine/threonine PP2A family protein phosphatase